MQICYSNRIFNWVKNRFIDLSTPADIEFNVHQHSMCLQRIEGNEFPRKEPRRVSKKEKMRLDFGGSLEYGFLRCTPRRDNERCKGEQEQIAPIYDWKIYALLTFIFTRREPDSLSGVESLRSMRNVNERNHLFSVLVIFAHFSPEFDRFSMMNRRRSPQTIDKWKRFWRFDAPWLAPERKLQVLFVLSFVDVFGLCRRCEERWKCRAWIVSTIIIIPHVHKTNFVLTNYLSLNERHISVCTEKKEEARRSHLSSPARDLQPSTLRPLFMYSIVM